MLLSKIVKTENAHETWVFNFRLLWKKKLFACKACMDVCGHKDCKQIYKIETGMTYIQNTNGLSYYQTLE